MARIVKHNGRYSNWATLDYIFGGEGDTILANSVANIATADKQAVHLISVLPERGVVESIGIIPGCV
jgi:hypothetical protein